MISIFKRKLGLRLFLLMASLLCSQSVFAQFTGNCMIAGADYAAKLPWYYSGLDFGAWLNKGATGDFLVATQSFNTTSNTALGGGIGVVCVRLAPGQATQLLMSTSTSVSHAVAPVSGSYFTIPGFNGIGFKVVLQWNNTGPLNPAGSGNQSVLANNVTTTLPSGISAVTNQANFTACSHENGGFGFTTCGWGGKVTYPSGDVIQSRYRQKQWVYSLYAVRTGTPNVTVVFGPKTALPVINVNSLVRPTNYMPGAGVTSKQYCIGCADATGPVPPIVVPAKCDIPAGSEKRSVNMNPSPVRWGDFAYTTTIAGVSSKVNATWTPVSISLTCDKAATASVTANDAATGTTNTDGKLLNSARTTSNVGIQVFYKTDGSATCSGAPTLSNGSPVPLNRTTPMTISGTSISPVLNLCARYYTTATTEAALDAGTESLPNSFTSTMNYTFTYE